jgi:hypothetical protein
MKARMIASSSRMTRSARPIWWAAKKTGVHRKFRTSYVHHRLIGQPLRSRSQTRQPAMAMRT